MLGLMKNKYIVFSVLAATVILVSGCDLFRTIAGRPTSSDLDGMRAELVRRQEAEKQALAEQAALEEKRIADSIAVAAALDTLESMGGILRSPEKLGGLSSSTVLDSKYYIVLGSFKEASNASRYAERIINAGFPAKVITFRTGFNSVGVSPSDNPAEFLKSLREVKKQDFFPGDFWILVNG